MVQGVDVDLFRPDDELKALAKLAVKLGVASALKTGSVDEALAAVGKAANGAQWLKAWKDAQVSLVQLHLRQRLLFRRQILDRAPRHSARLHQGLHRPAGAGEGHRPSDGGDRRGARPHHGRICGAARGRRQGGVRGQARPRPHRVPLCGEPQLLYRALGDERVLAQDARAQRAVASPGLLAEGGRHVLSLAPGSARRAVRLFQRLGGRRRADGTASIGRPRSNGGARSSPRSPPGRRSPRSTRRPKSSPNRSRSCSGASRRTA